MCTQYSHSLYLHTFQMCLCLNVRMWIQFSLRKCGPKVMSTSSAYLSCAVLFYLSYLVIDVILIKPGDNIEAVHWKLSSSDSSWMIVDQRIHSFNIYQWLTLTWTGKKLTWLIHCTPNASELYNFIVHFTVKPHLLRFAGSLCCQVYQLIFNFSNSDKTPRKPKLHWKQWKANSLFSLNFAH